MNEAQYEAMQEMTQEDWEIMVEQEREERALKKHNNCIWSTNFLTSKNIPFESFNGGNHLKIKHNNKVFEFWPTTGKYYSQTLNIKGRGIHNLYKELMS